MEFQDDFNSRLKALDGLDFDTVEFQEDIRGRNVLGDENQELGAVEDLLFDITTKRVRYIILKIPRTHAPFNRYIIVPAENIDFIDHTTIKVGCLNDQLIEHLPDYQKDQINPGVENMVRLVFTKETQLDEHQSLTGHPEIIQSVQNHDINLSTSSSNFNPTQEASITINAVFDDTLEAESAMAEIIHQGFAAEDLSLSSAIAKDKELAEINTNVQVANGGTILSIKLRKSPDSNLLSRILEKFNPGSVYETRN